MDATSTRKLPSVSGSWFSWQGNRGTSEFSSIPCLLGDRFIMRGRRREVEFVRVASLRSEEGELEAVDYRSTCGRFFVTVFND